MNLAPGWIPVLIDAGFEAVHWSTVGALNATDAEITHFAAANGQVVLTHDLDFGAILAATQRSKPSVVQILRRTCGRSRLGNTSSPRYVRRLAS
ncbi:MAG TPA: DUF5615 family PIN-like protein [Casimicrobiaceae bacterium]